MFHFILTLVLILSIWGLLKYLNWRRNIHYHLEKIGGPKAYPIIGNLYLFFGLKPSDMFTFFLKMVEDYGPIFRSYSSFKPHLHIMEPEQFEQIMTSSVLLKKGEAYDALKEWLGDGLLLSDGDKWHQRRKMITPAFHFKILENFIAVFSGKGQLLVEYLGNNADGKTFDIYPYIKHCTLDIICGELSSKYQNNKKLMKIAIIETAMGVSVNAMADRNSSYTRAINDVAELFSKRQYKLLQQTPLYPFLKDGKAFYNNLEFLHNFTDEVIAKRRKILKENPIKFEKDDISMTTKRRLSFLDLLLSTSSETLSDVEIRAEVGTFMFAGHDTTSGAICWTLYLLGLNQDAQEKVYQEIKGLLYGDKQLETISDLNELKYLECCIKESLRLYPSVPVISRLITEDVTISGYKIPKGTSCDMNIFSAHRNPKIFPNPEKFDPDRFLSENCKNRHPYAYVPFSAGPRNCVGQKFAMYEEKTLLAIILKSFKILPADSAETIKLVSEIVLRPEGGFKLALQKRINND